MKGFSALLIGLIGFWAELGFAQTNPFPQWGTLKPGPYSVGFQVFNQYDRGRYIQPKTDFEGHTTGGEKALPIQVSMWYPAEAAAGKPTMRFEEYLYLTHQKDTFRALTDDEKKQSADGIRFIAKMGANTELTDADLQAIRQTPTAAHRDAKPAKGRFPVILSGLDGGPSSANILYEYLASQGYVVLSTPSIGRTGTLQATRPQIALAERIGNLEFLLASAHALPSADPTRLGVLGINFDGMTALLFQMKNGQADAVVSIDGWEGKNAGSRTVQESPYFEANTLRVPYLVVLQDEKNPGPALQHNPAVFDACVYADRYHYVLNGMNHAFLIGNLGVLPNLPREKRTAYQFLHTTLFHFFEAHLKKAPTSLRFLKNTAQANGFPAEIIKAERKETAFPPVPTAEELEKIVMAGDVEKATRIYREAKRLNPGLVLFDEHTLNLYAFRFSHQAKPEKMLAIRQLAAEAFPQSIRAWENAGNAYQAANDKAQARQSFERALALVDQDTTLETPRKEQLRKSLTDKLNELKTKLLPQPHAHENKPAFRLCSGERTRSGAVRQHHLAPRRPELRRRDGPPRREAGGRETGRAVPDDRRRCPEARHFPAAPAQTRRKAPGRGVPERGW